MREPAEPDGAGEIERETAYWIAVSRVPHIGPARIDRLCRQFGSRRAAWSAPRPEDDRHKLALASYNAGLGSLLLSQQHCGNPATYDAIVACLPQVTGHHAAETLAYAPRIYQWFHMMVTAR